MDRSFKTVRQLEQLFHSYAFKEFWGGGGWGLEGVSTCHQNVSTEIILKLCFGGQSVICGFSLLPGILESNSPRKASDGCNTKTLSENNAVMLCVSSVHVRIAFVTTFSHL
jgi:hypothetical protein